MPVNFDLLRSASGAAALSCFCELACEPLRTGPFVILDPSLPTTAKQRRYWNAPHGSSLALALAETSRAHRGLVVAIARDTHAAHTLEAELGVFAGGDVEVLHFPDWETLPYDLFA